MTGRSALRKQMAVELQGREGRAYHEAGHAIADVRQGLGCDGVNIHHDKEKRTLGGAKARDYWNDEETAKKWLVSLYAGFAADERRDPSARDVALAGARGDFEWADEILALLYGDDDAEAHQKEWLDAARAFVADEKNWRAIEHLAMELLAHDEVDGQVVDFMVDHLDGHTTEAEYLHYRASLEHARRASKEAPPGAT